MGMGKEVGENVRKRVGTIPYLFLCARSDLNSLMVGIMSTVLGSLHPQKIKDVQSSHASYASTILL